MRRLDAHRVVANNRLAKHFRPAGERIIDGQHWDGGRIVVECIDKAIDHICGAEGSRGVVDKHLLRFHRRKTIANRLRSRDSADDEVSAEAAADRL